ncbi:hypothetical protein [Flavobacterium franklandianum]|uniref:hypothetical protein n=1 Tax=Flavobacterium franklandianum TaxID=2594430 RepID=UPI00163DA268|nr:hypothetical protein [Flavobacterium franklandianum]
MKKKLEADLMSIAHRVLQMKNKSDINQLCIETQRLYEKLSVLRFVEEHFDGAKPTIGQAEVVAKMKQFFEENHFAEVKPAMTKLEVVVEHVDEEETVQEIEEEAIEEIEEKAEEAVEEVVDQETYEDEISDEVSSPLTEVEFNETEPDQEDEGEEIIKDKSTKFDDLGFLPAFELDIESEEEPEKPKKGESIQISFEELLGADYTQTHFVKVEHNKTKQNPLDFELPIETSIQKEREDLLAEIQISSKDIEPIKGATIDKQAAGIPIGLNDRIAFVKHLFGNSDEDYNRVMNQLITFDSFQEAQNFIEDMVKPDYGDWQGKEEYEQRFIEIIEKKFA